MPDCAPGSSFDETIMFAGGFFNGSGKKFVSGCAPSDCSNFGSIGRYSPVTAEWFIDPSESLGMLRTRMWILVAEDEPVLARLLKQGLEEENHRITLARDGNEALSAVETSTFDAAVLDVMMPAMDGIEVTRTLRMARNPLPILMLTARDTPADVVRGLDAGADDYLIKPFSFKVLLARLRSITRRAPQPQVPTLQVDDLTLDPASREVMRAGVRIGLTATEFRLLEYLMRRAGRAASRSAIIEAVWGFNEDIEQNTVDAFIKLLREKADNGSGPKLIHTVRGFGYILRESA